MLAAASLPVTDCPLIHETIRVRSIVGRFLEYHRAFYFYAGGKEEVLLSSVDWMKHNFFQRIEVAFPILDKKLKRRCNQRRAAAFQSAIS